MSGGVCAGCGAAPRGGVGCPELLHDLLERTFAVDAAAYGVAVACYVLQHPAAQQDAALEWARFQLMLVVEQGLPLQAVRREARARFDRHRRQATRPPLRAALQRTPWRMTIGQLPPAGAAGFAPGLLRWARTILEDLRDATAAGDSRSGGGGRRPERDTPCASDPCEAG
jgi:hypothetical protein